MEKRPDLTRRSLSLGGIAAALCAGLPLGAMAQANWPNRPIRWIVGYPPGGGSDFLARTVAAALSEQLGQQVFIENRPGAGAIIGADVASKAPPDGYTLWTGDMGTLIFNPQIYEKLPYKVSAFQPVGLIGRFNMVLAAGPATDAKTIDEAIELMKKSPGKYNYGSVGIGTPHQFGMELFKKSVGVDVVHIPYKGLVPVVQDLLGGQIHFAPIDSATAQRHVESGKMRALAALSRSRLPQFPDVPTMIELGYKDVEMYAWQGMLVHADTPKAIVDVLEANLQKALARPDVQKAFTEYGLEVTPGNARQFGSYIESQTRFWADIVRSTGVKLRL